MGRTQREDIRTDAVKRSLPIFLALALLAPCATAFVVLVHTAAMWMILPLEGLLLCCAFFLYRWKPCRFLFWIAAFLVPPAVYCRAYFDAPITPGVLDSIEATRGREAWELLRLHPAWIIFTTLYIAVVLCGLATAYWGANPFTTRRLAMASALCLVVLPFGTAIWMHWDPPAQWTAADIAVKAKYIVAWQCFPLDVVYSQYNLIVGRRAVEAAAATRETFKFQAVRRTTTDMMPEVYVVVIGESSRRESWSLFGYTRDTNPLLSTLPRDEAAGLYLFRDVRSNANITLLSVPLVLTRATPLEEFRTRTEKSIVGLANEAGFDTYWISTQEKFGGFANSVTAMAFEAKHVIFLANDDRERGIFDGLGTGAYDADVLKPLAEAIASTGGSRKKVIFIHTMGSHADYRARVPQNHELFSKSDAPLAGSPSMPEDAQERVNAYDDTIVYTDFILRQIVDMLGKLDYSAGMLYFSDHGERTYCAASPRQSFSHGFVDPSADELDIPVVIWLSSRYRSQYPAAANAAASNEGFATSSDALFDTIVDLMRVDLARSSRTESLLSPAPAQAEDDVLSVDGSVRAAAMPLASCASPTPILTGSSARNR